MCVRRTAGGLATLQGEARERRGGGWRLKTQIDVNCESYQCQLEKFKANGKSPMVLLTRTAKRAMV